MERFIKVTGLAKLKVSPDTIRLNMNLNDACKEYDQAIKKSINDTNLLKEIIKDSNLNPKDLKTIHFNINTEYEDHRDKFGGYKREFIGYRYTHNAYIQFPIDNKKLSKLLFNLSKSNLNLEFNIIHTIEDSSKVKDELLTKAILDSKHKAEVLAKASNTKLGLIKTIDYSWSEMEITPNYNMMDNFEVYAMESKTS